MDYKEEFTRLVGDNCLEEARVVLDHFKIHALDDPFYYANMGWVLNHMERYEEAEIYLKKGIHHFPEDAWMYSQLGFCYDRQGRVEEGQQMMLRALSMGYDEAWIHGEIGWCYKELNDLQKAKEYFENALMEEAHNTWLLSQAAGVYAALQDLDTAEEYYVRSYRLLPQEDALYDLINFYRSHHMFEKELLYLEKVTQDDVTSWKHYEMGHAYAVLHQYENAYTYLKQALQEGRDDTGIRNDLGDTCRALEKTEEMNEHYRYSLSYYEKALQHETDTYWIYQEMIWIAHKQHDLKKKLAYLKQAEKQFKDDAWIMYHYARTYTDLDDHEHAQNACLFCLEHGDNRKEMYDMYAWNLGRNKTEDKALDILNQRIQEFGADDWVYGEMGWDYTQKKDYEKALLYFSKALELAPDNLMHVSMRGFCLLQMERYEEAKHYLDQAKTLGRNDGWIHFTYAEVLEQLHDIPAAIQAYEQALSLQYEQDWTIQEIERLKTLVEDTKNQTT